MDQNITVTPASQPVRYQDMTVEFETAVINDIECLFLDDVRQRFPTVTSLCIDNRQLAFLRDENGNRLEPQRIKACTNVVIDAVDPEGDSINSDICNRLDRLDENVQEIQKSIALIHTETQETRIKTKQIMVQMYELQEYTTPRHFYILPEDNNRGVFNTVKGLFHLQYKLYFLCDCSDEPNKRHVAPHEGYLIKKPKEFIATYGPYLRTTFEVVRAVLTVGSIGIPQFEDMPQIVTNTCIPTLDLLDVANIKNKLATVTELLNEAENTVPSVTAKGASQNFPLKGAQLRELVNYLEVVDKKNSLSNLYRMITDDGHVRWVCLEHYDTICFNKKTSEYIDQLEAFGGKFDQEKKEAVITNITPTSENIETFSNLLSNGFNMVSLVCGKCSLEECDLDKLLDVIINRSPIRRLVISDVIILDWRGKQKYICEYMCIQIKNETMEVQSPGRYQNGDTKILVRVWLQNKIFRVVRIHGFGDFPEYEESFMHGIQTKQESKALFVNHMKNIEFLNYILERESSLSQLKLNFCFNSSIILTRFCKALGNNRTLVELDVINYTGFDDEQIMIRLLKSLRNHKSLKTLSLLISDLKPSDEKERCLIDLLLKDSFLCRLRLLDSNISQELAQALVRASKDLCSLTYLELYNYQMDHENVVNLQLLHTNGNLAHLTISKEQYWCIALKDMRQQFQKELNQYQNLKLQEIISQYEIQTHIHLDGEQLTDRDMDIVTNDAIITKQCKQLSLVENKITSIGALILADALNNNTTLKALVINNNDLCDIGVYSLAKTLAMNNSTLEELNLTSNGITNEGVKHLVHMLKTNKTLTQLNLSENNITDEGVQILANAIQNDKTNIASVWLCRNKLLTDSSVASLIQMIKQSSTLKELIIVDCTLSDASKKRLNRAQELKQNFFLSV